MVAAAAANNIPVKIRIEGCHISNMEKTIKWKNSKNVFTLAITSILRKILTHVRAPMASSVRFFVCFNLLLNLEIKSMVFFRPSNRIRAVRRYRMPNKCERVRTIDVHYMYSTCTYIVQ